MITRFGMNKKSLDPINDQFPFYFRDDTGYHPCGELQVHGPSRSYYGPSLTSNSLIVWMTTESSISPLADYTTLPKRVHVVKENIQHNNQHEVKTLMPVCSLHEGDSVRYAMEYVIHGPCKLRYDSSHDPEVWIETDADVTLIGEQID